LALILPKRPKLSRGHHAAMNYADVPAFIGKLREVESMPRLALEFAILMAARSGEVLGARWDEINMAAKVWTIEAGRMKAGLLHRVPAKSNFTTMTTECISRDAGAIRASWESERRSCMDRLWFASPLRSLSTVPSRPKRIAINREIGPSKLVEAAVITIGRNKMKRGVLPWLLGTPIPIIILLALF
jgi:integrase